MASYRLEDGSLVRTENAVEKWEENTHWNGNNHISKATGSQWEHETLYKTKKGRYWVEHWSQWQGSTPSAYLVAPKEAYLWLAMNDHAIPEDLQAIKDEIEE